MICRHSKQLLQGVNISIPDRCRVNCTKTLSTLIILLPLGSGTIGFSPFDTKLKNCRRNFVFESMFEVEMGCCLVGIGIVVACNAVLRLIEITTKSLNEINASNICKSRSGGVNG